MALRKVITHECDRCSGHTPMTVKVHFCLGDQRFRLELCDRHGEALKAVLGEWSMYGEEVSEHRPIIKFGQARPEGSTAPIPFPVRVVPPEPELEAVPELEVEPLAAREVLPAVSELPPPPGGDEWRFTEHAVERMHERKLDPVEVLWAACRRDWGHSSKENPALMEYHRGDLVAIVNPDEHVIITAYMDDGRDQQRVEA